jgi:lipopolysaccharide transport system permease protein
MIYRWLSRMPELYKLCDPYFWMTAVIIARNAITREYQNSFLGVIWTVILPLIQVIIYSIIMPMIMARSVNNYAFYLVASFPLWAFMSASLVQASSAIINRAETLKRCMVSSVVFPISDVLKQFYTYLVSFLTMYVFCLMFFVSFDPIVLWLPLLLLPVLISTMASAITIAYVAPYVRDVGYLINMLFTILFWFTPVVYQIDMVPEHYRWLYWLNPFYILMHPVQQLVFLHKLPSIVDLFAVGVVMVASLALSFFMYRLCRRNYVYYL